MWITHTAAAAAVVPVAVSSSINVSVNDGKNTDADKHQLPQQTDNSTITNTDSAKCCTIQHMMAALQCMLIKLLSEAHR